MKELFSLIFLFASLSIHSFGANTFELQYISPDGNIVPTHSITRGGASAKVRLKISDPAEVTAGDYVFKSATGLYIKNKTTSSTVTTLGLNSSNNELSIHIGANAGTSIDIEMDVWAGQCFTFSATELNKDLTNPFSISSVAASTALTLIGNAKINIGKGAFLNYLELESVRAATPDANKIATFSYVLVNNSTEPFNGNFSFQESEVRSAYNIKQVSFYKKELVSGNWILLTTQTNAVANTAIGVNDNTFITSQPIRIPIMLLSGERIKVVETVQLNGCLQNDGTNSSKPLIKWGNAEYDMCANLDELTLKSSITSVNYKSNLVGVSSSNANHFCYGGAVTKRSYTLTNYSKPASSNEVIDVARNVMIDLYSSSITLSPFSIPFVPNTNNDNAVIYIIVNDNEKYIVNLDKYSLDNTTNYTSANLPSYLTMDLAPVWNNSGYGVYSNSIYNRQGLFFRPVNGFFTLNELITKVSNPAVTPDKYPFSAQCLNNDFDKKIIKDLYIDEYKRAGAQYANDPFVPIDIKPGDKVVLYWEEVNCCFKNDILSPDVFSSSVAYQYEDLCGRIKPNYFGSRTISGLEFQPAPSSGTTLGDVDRCTSTSDGLVERISSPILGVSYAVNNLTPDRYANRDGRIVFRVYVQNGLDLDKSFVKPTAWNWTKQPGYNNVIDEKIFVTNSDSKCVQGVCEADAVNCQLANIIPSGQGQYYVRLRPTYLGGNAIIAPQSIQLVASHNQIQLPGVIPSNIAGYNPDLVFNDNQLYANQLYEVAFNVEELLKLYETSLGASTVGNEQSALNALLFGSILDLDLRAYCSVNGKPSFKVVMYLDKCDGAPQVSASTSCAPGSGSTTMQPITSFGSSMIVNCPGCLIPGANIEQSFLVRSEKDRGLADLNGDRRPDLPYKPLPVDHPTLKKVAMGDEMTAWFQCYMSDGGDNNLSTQQYGITKSTLNNAALAQNNDNFYLDNFMVVAQITNAITAGANKNIDIVSVRMTYKGREIFLQEGDAELAKHLFYPDNGSFLLRANVRDFYVGDVSAVLPKTFETGSVEGVTCVLTYRVGDMGTTSTTSEITYAPHYTPCDDCNTIVGMTGVNPSDNAAFRPFDLTKLASYGKNTLWKCSGFSNKFKFIPYGQEATLRPQDNNCVKSAELGFTGYFNPNNVSQRAADFFEDEYRTFLKSDLKAEILVPKGYVASGITIVNTIAGGTETFKITSPTVLASILQQDPGNAEYPQYYKLLMRFESKNPPYNNFTLPLQTTFNDVFPDGASKSLTRGDENYSVRITVTYQLDPAMACSSIPSHVFIEGNIWDDATGIMHFGNRTNSPTHAFYQNANPIRNNPNADLPQTASYISKYLETSSATGYAKPTANLKAIAAGNQTLILGTTNHIEIPISISNLDIQTDPYRIPANQANYPYLQIYGDALTKGLKFIGAYRVDNTSQNKPYYPVLSTGNLLTEGILVGIDYQNAGVLPASRVPYLPAGGTQQYVLVFENTCPGDCNQNVGCGTQTSLSDKCLVGANNLKIGYGWNCSNYPSLSELSGVCGKFDPLNYTVNISPVGLTVSTFLNGNGTPLVDNQLMEIEPCDVSNTYKVTLNSCKENGFQEFEIEFSGISSEIRITPPATAGSFTVTRDATNNQLFHLTCSSCSLANQSVDVNFIIKSSCKVVGENLRTIVRSKTSCTPTAVTNYTLNNPLQIKTTSSTFFSDQILLSGNTISVVNGNYLNLNYSLVGAGNGVTKFDNAILVTVYDGTTSVYSETVAIPAGTASGLATKSLAMGIAACGTYRVELIPQLTYVPGCGFDSNNNIIPACKNSINGTVVSKNTLIGNPITASIQTIDGYASIICGSGSKVTFVAYPQTTDVTYSWSGPGITGAVTTNTIEATIAGTYSVSVSNLCGSSTATAVVADKLQVECPAPICPGEIPPINVKNFSGVVGTYKAQWYDPNGSDGNTQSDLEADILMDKGILTSGYYYAATITPSCTLRTNARAPEECNIIVKRAPKAYHITSDRPSGDASVLFLCDGQTTVFSVTNKSVNDAFPTDVIWRSGQTTTDDITAPTTWTSPGNLLTAEELEKSDYFIVAIDKATQCRTVSNEIAIETPRISIIRTCDNGNSIKLTAVSNFNVLPAQYDWELDGVPLVQGTNEVTATVAGVYTVIEHSTGCTLSNRCWGIKENLNTHAASNQELLSVQSGGFEGITATQVPLGFDTDFSPLDRSGYTGAALPADYTIGKFMINESGLQASDWSPNVPSTWVSSNTTYSGTGAMFIDGESEPASKLIWGETVPVTHGLNYLYRFKVRNLSLLTAYPVEEIPELYVQITYLDNAGNGTRYKTNKQALFNNGQTPWIEFSSYTPAIPVTIFDCLNPAEIETVRLELFMDGGGSIGRDVAIDDVSLIPIGICDDVVTLDLPCNAALAELDNNQLVICPGTTAEFNVLNAPAGLTYQWQSVVGTTLTTVGSGTSFVTPTLNLTDPVKPAIFQYQVTITDPVNHCQTRESAKVIVSGLPTLSITNNWTGSNCENKFVAVFNGLGTPAQFDWYLNGTIETQATTAVYVADNLHTDDVIQCKINNVWCSGVLPVESNSITISDIGLQANAGPDKDVCVGQSVGIGTTENADASYLWSPASNLNDATTAQPIFTQTGVESAEVFTLTLTDLTTGCISEDEIEVTVYATPVVSVNNPAAVCAPQTVDITAVIITQGSTAGLTYRYYSDAAATNALLNPATLTVSGTYYILGESTHGCTAIKPIVIDIKPEAVVVITNPAPVHFPGAIDLTLPAITSGSTAGLTYNYFIDHTATTALPTPAAVTSSGTYYIKGTSTDGCFDVKPVEVSIEHTLSNKSALAGGLNVTLNPNPFSIQAYMTVVGASSNYVVATVIDMNGRVVFEDTHVPNNQITTIGMELPSAVYILKIMDGDKIKIMKFVKL